MDSPNTIDEHLELTCYADSQGAPQGSVQARRYYLQNTLFSVCALTDDGQTSAGVRILEAYEYDPYGKHTLLTDGNSDGQVNFDPTDTRTAAGASAMGNGYTFTGREFDPESGLHHYRYRYYNQDRFISRDPIGFEGGSHLYQAYFINDGVDPFGLRPDNVWDSYWDPQDFCPLGNCLSKDQAEKTFYHILHNRKASIVLQNAVDTIKCKCGGKYSPCLLAAIFWDEMVGSGANGSGGYSFSDFQQDIGNTFGYGNTYGPFQISRATVRDIMSNSYYMDMLNIPASASGASNKNIENLLQSFSQSAMLAASQLCRIMDFWTERKGPDLSNRDDILGSLYSIGLAGKRGVNDNPKSTKRGREIAKMSKELNLRVFHSACQQVE